MIVTHNIGSLSAELKLTALSSRQGKVIHDNISWCLLRMSKEQADLIKSKDPQPVFGVTEGKYQIQVIYKDETFDLGQVELKQNTRTDAVFILNSGDINNDGEYFSEIDPVDDFARRQQEREHQSEHGAATLPLRDPSSKIEGNYGQEILAHPLLANSAQFDGVPPDMRPDPAENEAAMQLTLAAQLTNQNQPGQGSAPTPNM